MEQVNEKMLLSSLQSSGMIHTQVLQEGESRTGRRNKKAAAAAAAKGGEAVGEGKEKKRRLSEEQVEFLETYFGRERKLESGRKARLASELGLDPKQVSVWFQNRRARWKAKRLEEDYAKLKSTHDAALLHNCHLQAEVFKLKEQLSDAEKEIRKLTAGSSDGLSCGGGGGGVRSGIPSSSFAMKAHHYQPNHGEFETGDAENLMYNMQDHVEMMDWMNLYGLM